MRNFKRTDFKELTTAEMQTIDGGKTIGGVLLKILWDLLTTRIPTGPQARL